MVVKWFAFVGFCAALFGQELKPVIDNERVTVWDVTGAKGQANPALGHDRDVVVMRLTGAGAGSARFIAKGSERNKPPGIGARSLIIELKDTVVPTARKQNRISARLPASAREEAARKRSRDRMVLPLEPGRADADAFSRQGRRGGLSGAHGPDLDHAPGCEDPERVQGFRCSL